MLQFHVLALTPAQSPPTLVPMEILCFFGKSFCFSLDPILSSIDLYVFPTHRIFLGCPENRPFSTLSSHMVLCDSLGRISRILLTWSPFAHRLSLGAFPLFLFQISCFLSSRPSSFRCLYIIQWWFFIPQTSVRSCGLLHEKKGFSICLVGNSGSHVFSCRLYSQSICVHLAKTGLHPSDGRFMTAGVSKFITFPRVDSVSRFHILHPRLHLT
ncbi:hypothetical protein DFS34DRAFT_606450, partial [Phlyctochytrium arcticum]